jgi:hypothetical protein
MKIEETILLLTPFKNCPKHKLSKHIGGYLRVTASFDRCIYEPLQEIFLRVIMYDFQNRMTEIGLKAVNEELIELVRKKRPKYAVWISSYYEFQETTINLSPTVYK